MTTTTLPSLSAETKAAMLRHARASYPREACGLLVVRHGKEVFWPCRNVSESDGNFEIAPEDYAAAEEAGDVIAVLHSHCNLPPTPSVADRTSCEGSGIPWHILSLPTETWDGCVPVGFQAPLIGRLWVHRVHDCYTLVRDWYREEMGLEIPDFDREFEWWKKGANLYMENFERAGFRRVDGETLTRGDGLIMQIGSDVPNHAAVFLGDGLILHHLQNRLSCRDVYGGYWKKNTVAVVRYAR